MAESLGSNPDRRVRRAWALCTLVAAGLAGCAEGNLADLRGRPTEPPPGSVKIPRPIHLLLPRTVSIHPFTGMRSFDEAGGVKGIDVRIEAKDAFGDPGKAFGTFIFDLYEFRSQNPDPRGRLIATWNEDLMDPEKNLLHWNIHRTYEFKLLWEQPIPVGQRFILRAIFTSPFTERLIDERVFIAGQ